MSKNKRKNRPGNENLNNSTAADTNVTPAADFDPYNDDKTKEIVGSLFDEFVEDGGTNYFADYTDPFLDTENEDTESLRESISRRRRRSVAPAKKSIVFRMKPKKKKSEEFVEDEELEDDFPEEEEISPEDTEDTTGTSDEDADEPIDMEKTIILPKLSNFFKKSADKEDEEADEEEDDFFSELNKKSEARSQAAASKEEDDEDEVEEISYESRHAEEAPAPVRKRRSKNIFADLESPYDTGLNKNKSEEDDEDDDYDEKIVEINLMRTLGAALVVIFVVVIIALCVKNASLSKQLKEANDTITELRKSGNSSTLATSLEELQAENESLKAENESLKGGSGDSDDHAAAIEILGDTGTDTSSSTSSDSSASTSSGSTGSTTYTVASGDSIAKISKKQYGSEAYVDQILQANGLTESSQLQIGQTLTLPAIN
jgi:LysM repeat protein